MFGIFSSLSSVVYLTNANPFFLANKALLVSVIIYQIGKTMFFLRIFDTLSYLVTMIYTVLYDLRIFMIFYMILIFFFSLIMCVLSMCNYKIPGKFQDEYNLYKDMTEMELAQKNIHLTYQEYKVIGPMWGNMFNMIRLSLGDFDFDASVYLSPTENFLFFIVWLCAVFMLCIIMLNFVIAETSNSYASIVNNLKAETTKAKAFLVREGELVIPQYFKNDKMFP